jgi:hypothetical protein
MTSSESPEPDTSQRPLLQLSKAEVKIAMKEALKEWLDEKYTAFGKYSFFGLGGFILSAFIYFILTTNGWRPPV